MIQSPGMTPAPDNLVIRFVGGPRDSQEVRAMPAKPLWLLTNECQIGRVFGGPSPAAFYAVVDHAEIGGEFVVTCEYRQKP